MSSQTRNWGGEHAKWSDARLVRECIQGDEQAWSSLIDKYKNLIYSIPVKYGFSPEDAADIFQAVIADLLSDLSQLREPMALPAWLIQITSHRCFQWRRQQQRYVTGESLEAAVPGSRDTEPIPEELLHQLESEQKLRESLSQLSTRCRQLIQMLFYEDPTRPYQEVAALLGIATGSVGFIRRRCLERLRVRLVKVGFS